MTIVNVARVQCKICYDELRSYAGRFVWCRCHEATNRGIAIDHTKYYTRLIGNPEYIKHLPSLNIAPTFKEFVIHHDKLLDEESPYDDD